MSLSQKYYLQGKQYIEKERYDKAEESFKKLIELNPIFVDAYNELGNVYYEQQNFQQAQIWYKKAIKINPKISDFYNNLGNVYSDDKQYQKAVGQYQKAMKLNLVDPDVHNNLANAYYNCQQYIKAINQFKIAIKLNPYDPDYKINLSCIYTSILKRQNPDRFEDDWNFDQNSTQGHIFLGRFYHNNGLLWEAVQQYQSVIRLNPDSEPHYYDLIELYEDLKVFDKIIQLYQIIPTDFREKFLDMKKNAIKQKKILEFESSIKNFPEEPKKHYEFGKSLLKQGYSNQARQIFERAEMFYQNQGILQQIQFICKKFNNIEDLQQNQTQKQSKLTKPQSEVIVDYEKIKQYFSCELFLFNLYLKDKYFDDNHLAEIIKKINFFMALNQQQEKTKILNKIGVDQSIFKKIDCFFKAFQLIRQKQMQIQKKYEKMFRNIKNTYRQIYRLLQSFNSSSFFEKQIILKCNKNLNQSFEQIIEDQESQTSNQNFQIEQMIMKKIKQKLSSTQKELQQKHNQQLYPVQNKKPQRRLKKQKSESSISQDSYPQEQYQQMNNFKARYQKNQKRVNQVFSKAKRVHNQNKKQQNQMKLKKKLKKKQTKFSLNEIKEIYSKMFEDQLKKDKQEISDELYALKNKLEEYQNCFDKNQLLTNKLNELQKQNKKKISNYGKKLYSFLVSIIQAYRMLDTNMLQKGEGLHQASGMVSKLLNYAEMLPIIGEVTSFTKQVTSLYWQKQDEIRSKTIVTNLSYFWNQKLMSDAVSEIVSLLINEEKYCTKIQEYQQEESGDIFQIFEGKKEEVVRIFTKVQKKQEQNQQKLAIIDSSYILLGLAQIRQEQIQQFKKKNPQTENILIIQVEKLIQFRKVEKQKQIKQQKDKNQNTNSTNSQGATSNKTQKQVKKPLKNLKYSIVFIFLIILSLILTYGPTYLQQSWSLQYQSSFNQLYDCFNQSPQHKIALNILAKNQYTIVQGSVQGGLFNLVQYFSNQEIKKQKNVIVQQFYTNQNGMIEFSHQLKYDIGKDQQQKSADDYVSKTTWMLISWTASKIPKQAILKIIANNPEDKVIIVLPQDEGNQKINRLIKFPKFKTIQLSSIDQNYVKASILRNHKFDQEKSDILYDYFENSKTIFQAFDDCSKCSHQKLVGEDYRELKQFSEQDKRVLNSLCKKGKIYAESISRNLLDFGLIGQSGLIYWKNQNSMLNYMLHKNKLCNKSGVIKTLQQVSDNKQTQIKMYKMKVKKSGGSNVFQVQQQQNQQNQVKEN